MRALRLSLLVLLAACDFGPTTAKNDDLATGLVATPPEELRSIPFAQLPFSGDELPASVDLSADMPPPGQQGKQNSCVGWAVAYALKSYHEKVEEKLALLRTDGSPDPGRIFSPAFIYNQVNNGRDGGCRFTDAFNILSEQGAATWNDMPYDAADYSRKPNDSARQNAKRYRIAEWRRVNVADTKELKVHLRGGYPIIFGANVDEGFQKAPRGRVWNAESGRKLGMHAMTLVGYDDSRRAFKVLNSWGKEWADDGYGWIDYDHFRRVTPEGYVVRDAVNGPKSDTPRPAKQQAQFQITNVMHNAEYPNRPDLGKFVRFDGTLRIPPGMGRSTQIVIYFHYDAGNGQKGQGVRSLNAQYVAADGITACGTAQYPVPAEGVNTTWMAWLPYAALDIPTGEWVGTVYNYRLTALLAEPMLFIDNFGVATGGVYPFNIQK